MIELLKLKDTYNTRNKWLIEVIKYKVDIIVRVNYPLLFVIYKYVFYYYVIKITQRNLIKAVTYIMCLMIF